jgi:tetratricopeptide (TPR) repeat protein
MSTLNEYPPSILNAYLHYAIKWAGPRTLFIRYEDLIGEKTDVIKSVRSLLDFIGLRNIDESTLTEKIASGADPAKSGTFRSGNFGEWQKEFTQSHVEQFKIVTRGLVSALGYEPDENWEIGRQDLVVKSNSANLPTNESIIPGQLHLRPVNIQALLNFQTTKGTLSLDEYLHVRSCSESSETERLVDGWALKIFIETNQLESAICVLESLLASNPTHPRWNYYYAFCLHRLKKYPNKALEYYNLALENGFDEYWVRYNRSSLLASINMLEEALIDIRQATQIKSTRGASALLELIESKLAKRQDLIGFH